MSRIILPWMENKGFVRTLTFQGLAALLLVQVAINPTKAFDYSVLTNPELTMNKVEIVTTETTFAYPVTEPRGISQSYVALHRGVDIRAAKGTAVVAIDKGTVIEVEHYRVGYGKHVRIAHEGMTASLYAHLNEVEVEVGQKVGKGQKIGTVGTSGWTTGPHLHFELTVGEKTINPELWM